MKLKGRRRAVAEIALIESGSMRGRDGIRRAWRLRKAHCRAELLAKALENLGAGYEQLFERVEHLEDVEAVAAQNADLALAFEEAADEQTPATVH